MVGCGGFLRREWESRGDTHPSCLLPLNHLSLWDRWSESHHLLQSQHCASRQVNQNQLLIQLFSLHYLVVFMQSGPISLAGTCLVKTKVTAKHSSRRILVMRLWGLHLYLQSTLIFIIDLLHSGHYTRYSRKCRRCIAPRTCSFPI